MTQKDRKVHRAWLLALEYNIDSHYCAVQIKEHNNVSRKNRENWEYFGEMDAIPGTRPTSVSVTWVHSGVNDISQVPNSVLNG